MPFWSKEDADPVIDPPRLDWDEWGPGTQAGVIRHSIGDELDDFLGGMLMDVVIEHDGNYCLSTCKMFRRHPAAPYCLLFGLLADSDDGVRRHVDCLKRAEAMEDAA